MPIFPNDALLILQAPPVHLGIFSLLGLQVNRCYRQNLALYHDFPIIGMEGHVLSWRLVSIPCTAFQYHRQLFPQICGQVGKINGLSLTL